MKRLIISLVVTIYLPLKLFCYEYNQFLLKSQISIFPKLLIFDENLNKKIKNKTIIFAIIYDKSDKLKAEKFQSEFQKSYQKLSDYKINFKLFSYDEVNYNTNATSFYLLKSNKASIKKVVSIALVKKITTFSYENNYLKYGVLISSFIEDTNNIYINKDYIRVYDTKFDSSLLQIVRFYHDKK